MSTGTIGQNGGFIKHRDKMFVYFSYDIDAESVTEPSEIYLWDRDKESTMERNDQNGKIIGTFKVES